MDFDPRDYDSRDEDRAPTRDRGGRGGSGRDDERDDEWSRPAAFPRDRDDEGRDLGRGRHEHRRTQHWDGLRGLRRRKELLQGMARAVAAPQPAADASSTSSAS